MMREATERPEAAEAGTAILVGTDKDKIVRETSRLLIDDAGRDKMSKIANPFGDGKAARRIADYLEDLRNNN